MLAIRTCKKAFSYQLERGLGSNTHILCTCKNAFAWNADMSAHAALQTCTCIHVHCIYTHRERLVCNHEPHAKALGNYMYITYLLLDSIPLSISPLLLVYSLFPLHLSSVYSPFSPLPTSPLPTPIPTLSEGCEFLWSTQ